MWSRAHAAAGPKRATIGDQRKGCVMPRALLHIVRARRTRTRSFGTVTRCSSWNALRLAVTEGGARADRGAATRQRTRRDERKPGARVTTIDVPLIAPDEVSRRSARHSRPWTLGINAGRRSVGHGHGSDHRHEPASTGRAFAVGIALNLAFVAIEGAYGVRSGSTALLADATHNLSDVLGLMIAWTVSVLAQRKATVHRTYGLRASTILGALANALFLLVVVGGLAWESIHRLREPAATSGPTMIAVAAAGVLVNGVSALMFMRSQKRDANVRAAFLHLLADAAVSLGVVVAGAIIWKTSLAWVDPVTSLAISAVVLIGTWQLLKEAIHLALAGVPPHVDAASVREYLAALPEVCEVHDLHVWALSTTEVALTAHVVMPWTAEPPAFMHALQHELHERFGIDHATVQIEPLASAASCRQAREGAV
jgi:cobalt-zinc-cadmium efflux system protein